jgi:ribosomal-protein-alanine N-acetyltransferase
MVFEELKTKRLTLRKLTPEVYKYVFENCTEEELLKFFGFKTSDELFPEEEKYRQGLSSYNKSLLLFLIILNDSKKVIGWCGFHTWYTNHFRAEVGYALNYPEDMNKGIMSEALAAVINYGFNVMDLHRIEAFVAPGKSASLTLLEKFKFKKEGYLKEHYFKDNKLEDSVLYALLKGQPISLQS